VIAAAVIGDVGQVARFPDRDHFAAYNGTAPIEVSSGGRKIWRLSRRGNRRLNHAIHMAGSPRSATGTARATPTTTRNWPKARPAKKLCAR
jgi:transposase